MAELLTKLYVHQDKAITGAWLTWLSEESDFFKAKAFVKENKPIAYGVSSDLNQSAQRFVKDLNKGIQEGKIFLLKDIDESNGQAASSDGKE